MTADSNGKQTTTPVFLRHLKVFEALVEVLTSFLKENILSLSSLQCPLKKKKGKKKKLFCFRELDF